MYISGNSFNFLARSHQLPTGISDIDTFLIEGSGYVTGWNYPTRIAASKQISKDYQSKTTFRPTGHFYY